ncbi:gustatory receptor 68a-like [Venturia canescens]|uniref:gustatory receptor 68a-like n=1 Tax=Venturia canescens TaxID=32260 RepID=UPI001C9CD3A0|nr:gustatory receptor 68a-like [Venturia canescens]
MEYPSSTMQSKDFGDWITSKFRIKPKNMKQLMMPMLISGWAVGRGVIELPLGKRWPLVSCLYSGLTIFGYFFVAKITMEDLHVVVPAASSIGMWIINPMICIDICLVICNVIIGWKGIRNVADIINRLEESGRKVEKIGILQDYSKVYCGQLVLLICEVIFAIFIMLFAFVSLPSNERSGWHKMATSICIYYPFIVISIGDAEFITLVRSITLRFERLNKVLEDMSTTTDRSPQHKRALDYIKFKERQIDGVHEKCTNDDERLIRAVAEDHLELVRIGGLINATFGTQALLSMTLSFVCLLGLLYRASALVLWSTLTKDSLDKELVVLLGWVFYYIYRIIVMTTACMQAVDECKKTATIICQLHEPSTKKGFRNEISNFLLQMTQNTVEFTACRLFSLDHSCIQRIIGTITTYLVILVQINGDLTSSMPGGSKTKVTKNK